MQTDTVGRPLRPRSRFTAIAAGAAVVVIACGATTLFARQAGFTLHFGGSGSAVLLDDVLKRAGIDVSRAQPTSVIGPDGPMPQIASRMIRMPAGSTDALPPLKRACAALGLREPRPDEIAGQPGAICTGQWRQIRASIAARFTCDGSCLLDIEAHTLKL